VVWNHARVIKAGPEEKRCAAAWYAALTNAPAGSIVRGDPVSTVVLLDKKTGYHLAQWNL
jgi:hypothetical protein